MGFLGFSHDLSLARVDRKEAGEPWYVTTGANFCADPMFDDSTYEEEVPVDDEFWISVNGHYVRLDMDELRKNIADEHKDEDEGKISTMIMKSFRRPLQALPRSYEDAWRVAYKWLEEEFDDVLADPHVLPVLTEELVHCALHLVDEIPKGRKTFEIELYGVIEESILRLPKLINSSIFTIEVMADEVVEVNHPEDESREFDEVFVINVYTEYKPLGVEKWICEKFNCRHPASELYGLETEVLQDLVSVMLRQVHLHGDFPRLLVISVIGRIMERMLSQRSRKSMELDATLRVTEITCQQSQPPKGEDASATVPYITRLSIHPDLLVKPLHSTYIPTHLSP